MHLGEYLEVVDGSVCCRKCGHRISSEGENYKEKLKVRNLPMMRAGYMLNDPASYVDVPMVFRQFICPGCATLIENELSAKDSPILEDKRFLK